MRTALGLAVAPTLALLAALAFAPGRSALWVHLWLLVAGAVALGSLLAALRRAFPDPGPSAFERALAPRASRPGRLAELSRLEREVELGLSTAFDLHVRLRPRLRSVADELLAARRGVELDREPERARAILGDEAWELVRPDRERPEDRHGPGLDRAALGRVLDALEGV